MIIQNQKQKNDRSQNQSLKDNREINQANYQSENSPRIINVFQQSNKTKINENKNNNNPNINNKTNENKISPNLNLLNAK